ncbi:alanine-tRNA ligase [Capsicum annuum]|uniref:alanine--tRNA ligase n=1 Tax=Capsicum annuum TaxID=4072 RepID=UPI0007BEDFEA|nr:alanine--tRNA ligase [Capsicum annuum]XP_016575242.1 alanine--tRNA ligase [Capsicum annuum]
MITETVLDQVFADDAFFKFVMNDGQAHKFSVGDKVICKKVTSLNAAVERAQILTVMKTDLKAKFSVLQNQVTKAKKKIAAENIQKAVKAASETSGALASGGKSYCILQIDVGLDTGAVREAVVKVMEQKVIRE